MYNLLRNALLFLQCHQLFLILALKPDLFKLMGNSKSALWPLQAGFPGLAIANLNEYISLFRHCLINIQNYQGIEVTGITTPIYLTRYDVAYLDTCLMGFNFPIPLTYRFLFGKIPPQSELNCTIENEKFVKYTDKSMTARWYCTAQFDLFFPEPSDAPHIVKQSQSERTKANTISYIKPDYKFKPSNYLREWSKTL